MDDTKGSLMLHRKWMLKSTNVHYPRYKIKKGEITFSICPDGNLYPELKAFNGMLWVYVGDKNKKDFNKAYVQKRNWKDVFWNLMRLMKHFLLF